MKLLVYLCSLALIASSVSSQSYPLSNPDEEHPPVVNTIAQLIVDWISRAIQYFFELIDLKVRSIRFLTSLYTTDNLQLLRRFMNIGLRFGGWVYDLVPNSTTEGNNRFLSFLFPQVDQKDEDYESFQTRPRSLDVEDDAVGETEENMQDVEKKLDEANSIYNLIYARRR